ncbi:Hypothetical protein GLP15_807 [Giardia lamblia P15]|uniref:Uncharacterized protein n=1 Tax=Giardia intestinalis (strain P15) TaxID=658858 RepID=E1EXU7_GIAIA|nr:Hypothetical protein GLP15_807 [Giardia lamblia P15]
MRYIFDRVSLESQEAGTEECLASDIISSTRISADTDPEPEQRCCIARPITVSQADKSEPHTSRRERELHSEIQKAREEMQCEILSTTVRKAGSVKVFSTATDETVRVSTHQVPIQQIRRAEPSPRRLIPTHNVISNTDFEVTRIPRPSHRESSRDGIPEPDLVSTITRKPLILTSKCMEKSNLHGLHTNEEESSFLESSVSDCKRVLSSTVRNSEGCGKAFPNDSEVHANNDSDNDYLYTVTSTIKHSSLAIDDVRIFEVKNAIDERRRKKDYSNESWSIIKIDMPPKGAIRDISTPFMANTSPMETDRHTQGNSNVSMTFNRVTAVRVTPTKSNSIEIPASYANHRAEGSTRAIYDMKTPVEHPVMHSGMYGMMENVSEDEIDTDYRVVDASVSDSVHSDYSDGNYCVQSRMERIRRPPIKESTYSVIKGTAARVPAPIPTTFQEGDNLRCFVLTFVDTEPKKFN